MTDHDYIYYQNIHYNNTTKNLDSQYLTSLNPALLDSQNNYSVAVNKFKISDLSTVPIGFNIPFNQWEVALKYNGVSDIELVPQIGSSEQQKNILFTLDADIVYTYTYTNNGSVLTSLQTIELSNSPTGCLFVVSDSTENIYVATSTNLFAYDPTGELLESYSFTDIQHLSIAKNDLIFVCDSDTISVMTYQNNQFNLVHTITKDNTGAPFSGLTACIYDSSALLGSIYYNLVQIASFDNGYNVLDSHYYNNVVNLQNPTQIGKIAYAIENTENPIVTGDIVCNLDTTTNTIQLFTNYNVPVSSFTPSEILLYAFYDSINSVFYGVNSQRIYAFDTDPLGTYISEYTVLNLTNAYFYKDTLITCENGEYGIVNMYQWDNENDNIFPTRTIRVNAHNEQFNNCNAVSTDGVSLVIAYNENQITTYMYSTLTPINDFTLENIKRIEDIAVDNLNGFIYITEDDYQPSLLLNTMPTYAGTGNNFDPNVNFYNYNTKQPATLAPATMLGLMSIAPSQTYIFGSGFTTSAPYVDVQVATATVPELFTLTSGFGPYATYEGDRPFFITNIFNGDSIINLGLSIRGNGTSNMFIDLQTQEADNEWRVVMSDIFVFPTDTPEFPYSANPYQLIVNPFNNLMYLLTSITYSTASPSVQMFVSSGAPTFLETEPYIDMTGITWTQMASIPNLISGMTFDQYRNNVVYYTLGNNDGIVYTGNVTGTSIINQEVFIDDSSQKFYGYLLIPNKNIYNAGAPQTNLYQLSLTEGTAIKQKQININNNMTFDVPNRQILVSYDSGINIYDTTLNQIDNIPIATGGVISLGYIQYVSRLLQIDLTSTTFNITNTFEFRDTHLNALSRNATNNLVLCATDDTAQLVFFDSNNLIPKYSTALSNNLWIFSESLNVGIGNPNLQVYSLNDYVSAINETLNTCLQNIRRTDPSIRVDTPFFELNRSNGLLTLYYDSEFTQNNYGIYLGKKLYQFFKFSITPSTDPALQQLNKILLTPSVSGQEITDITQTNLSLYQLNQLDKLVLETSLDIFSDVTGGDQRSLNIFTEFDIDTSNPVTMYNDGSLLYSAVLLRNYSMISTNKLQQIQYSMWYQFKNGERYKFYISPNNNISLKLQFTRIV